MTLETRQDMLKRLFAASVSIGFGLSVTNIISSWNATEHVEAIRQTGYVIAGLVIAFLSWESYFIDVQSKRVVKTRYHAVDLTVTLSYALMLVATRSPVLWSFSLMSIFMMYTLRDTFDLYEHDITASQRNV